jgi:hypothetical protein
LRRVPPSPAAMREPMDESPMDEHPEQFLPLDDVELPS